MFFGGARSLKMTIHLRSLHNKILALIAKTHRVNIMRFSVGGIDINIFVNGGGWGIYFLMAAAAADDA